MCSLPGKVITGITCDCQKVRSTRHQESTDPSHNETQGSAYACLVSSQGRHKMVQTGGGMKHNQVPFAWRFSDLCLSVQGPPSLVPRSHITVVVQGFHALGSVRVCPQNGRPPLPCCPPGFARGQSTLLLLRWKGRKRGMRFFFFFLSISWEYTR